MWSHGISCYTQYVPFERICVLMCVAWKIRLRIWARCLNTSILYRIKISGNVGWRLRDRHGTLCESVTEKQTLRIVKFVAAACSRTSHHHLSVLQLWQRLMWIIFVYVSAINKSASRWDKTYYGIGLKCQTVGCLLFEVGRKAWIVVPICWSADGLTVGSKLIPQIKPRWHIVEQVLILLIFNFYRPHN